MEKQKIKNNMKKILISLLFILFAITQIKSQDFNIQQTLDYINKKVNDNKSFTDKDKNYVWEVDKDGKLTITQYVNNEWNFSQSVYLKALDKNRININDDIFDQDSYFYTINVKCLNNSADVIKKYKRIIHSSSIFIRLVSDDRVANQLRNAISYLILLSEQKPEYKSKDIDPFDFQKALQVYQESKPLNKKNKKK